MSSSSLEAPAAASNEESSPGSSSWDFIAAGLGSSVSLLETPSYRPWEGSELLLRPYYDGERLPSFESQFNYEESAPQTPSNNKESHPTLISALRGAGGKPPKEEPQVAAVSSSGAPGNPHLSALGGVGHSGGSSGGHGAASVRRPLSKVSGGRKDSSSSSGDKTSAPATKKKRKRCGECCGCQKKDNCGDCAPCRNEKSHQICKVRRCERLIEKKPKKCVPSEGKISSSSLPGRPRSMDLVRGPHPSSSLKGPSNPRASPQTPQQQPQQQAPPPPQQQPQQPQQQQQQHFGFGGTPLEGGGNGGGLWSSPVLGGDSPWSGYGPPSSGPAGPLFEHHFAESFIRRPSHGGPQLPPPPSHHSPLLLSPPSGPYSSPHELNPSPSGLVPPTLNGNHSVGHSLGYNLSVSAETKPYSRHPGGPPHLVHPQQQQQLLPPNNQQPHSGNSQPGCPLILPQEPTQHTTSSRQATSRSAGHPGGNPGGGDTRESPDSTSNFGGGGGKSFLAYRAEKDVAQHDSNNSNHQPPTVMTTFSAQFSYLLEESLPQN